MNKLTDYQSAWNRLVNREYKYEDISSVYNDLEILRPLVEKATPKKAIKSNVQDMSYITKYECPNCGMTFGGEISDYCYHCGQAIYYEEKDDGRIR